MKIAAIITAGGTGTRMGADRPKQYLEVAGKPIIVHTLSRFAAVEDICHIVVVVPPGDAGRFKEDIVDHHSFGTPIDVVDGGDVRQRSVWNGLKSLPDDIDVVLIHDGVRPFIREAVIRKSIDAAAMHGASVVAMPLKETIKRVGAARDVDETVDRAPLWGAQTPQAFRLPLIRRAFEEAWASDFVGTDDAMLVERLGNTVKVVEGDYHNIKITTPEDLAIAEAIASTWGSDEDRNRL